MTVEFAVNSPNIPWLENWAIYAQLWANAGVPGGELQLDDPINRGLAVRLRDRLGLIVFSSGEADLDPAIFISSASRGLVEIRLGKYHWSYLRADEIYSCELLVYGVLQAVFPFSDRTPAAGRTLLNGVQVYGSPSGILNLIGMIPGADVSISVDLSDGWTLNDQGYWVKQLTQGQKIYGLWVNGHHSCEVPYKSLAVTGDRSHARVGDTLFYKGPETLTFQGCPFGIETAHNPYVLRCLQQASTEIEQKTGRVFSKNLVVRETHRTTRNQRQVFPKLSPVANDRYLRLDNYSQGRSLSHRLTESDVDVMINLDSESGIITLNHSWWDFSEAVMSSSFWGGDRLWAGEMNTEITYTGGADLPPVDIDEAASCIAAIRQAVFWQQALTQGLQSVEIGCASLNFGELLTKYSPDWQQRANSIICSRQSFEFEAI